MKAATSNSTPSGPKPHASWTGLALALATSFLATPAPSAPHADARSVAVTFDDVPGTRTDLPLDVQERLTQKLLAAVAAEGVPAIGFVNENKLLTDDTLDPRRVALLERWLDAGLELGNHSYSHPDLHRTPLKDFQQDVLEGEIVTRRLLARRGQTLRFFRHPYLHTGRSLETKQALEAFLARHGYRVAPVTVDNSEWIFARAYDRLLDDDDPAGAARIAAAYVPYMEAKFAYFESQTRTLFGRSVPQVLLLHANRLNADHFSALAAMLKGRGYVFVSIEHALKDPAYRSEDRYTGPAGITWLHRWALARGVEHAFFKGEPLTPPFVLKAAGVESE